jgi:hypothetical protein
MSGPIGKFPFFLSPFLYSRERPLRVMRWTGSLMAPLSSRKPLAILVFLTSTNAVTHSQESSSLCPSSSFPCPQIEPTRPPGCPSSPYTGCRNNCWYCCSVCLGPGLLSYPGYVCWDSSLAKLDEGMHSTPGSETRRQGLRAVLHTDARHSDALRRVIGTEAVTSPSPQTRPPDLGRLRA